MIRIKKYLCSFLKLLLVLLYGCTHADFVSSYVSYTGGVFNQARDTIAFARYYSTFQRPTGMSRFPDGGRVRKIHTSFDLYLLNLTDKSVKKITDIHLNKYHGLPPRAHISCGGEKLIYTQRVSKNRITLIINFDGSGKREIGSMGIISPDGKYIAFKRSSEIWIMDLENEKKKMLFKGGDFYRLYWENSGRYIYVKTKDRKKLRISVETGKRQYVKEFTNLFDNSISIKKVEEYVSAIDYEDWGYPTPLDYNKKSIERYEKDLILKRGDPVYRDAVAKKLLKEYDREKIAEIIVRMEQRLKELKGSKKIYYDMYLPEMRAKLAPH
jgi:hypothetical protein